MSNPFEIIDRSDDIKDILYDDLISCNSDHEQLDEEFLKSVVKMILEMKNRVRNLIMVY